jgi:alpha-L-fucosidase
MRSCFPFLFLFLGFQSFSQSYYPAQVNLNARDSFQDDKFGMFIHWGVSSALADGEWVMENKGIRFQEYRTLGAQFNPIEFNAASWVKQAKMAGMKYMVFITRHHDGFSNWDTRFSDWKITNTPYGKDVLKMLATECKKQGIKLGLYYSTLDWSRSDYPYETGRTGKKSGRTEKSDYESYFCFMKNQLTELLTEYGPISCIWLDGHWDQTNPEGHADRKSRIDWRYDELYELIHHLQPQCMIGNNHHLDPFPGEDFQMFEQDLPGENKSGLSFQSASKLPLESCITMNGSWGYRMTDKKFKTTNELVKTLVGAAGRNSNLLLNVGPMPNGEIQLEFSDTLKRLGKWVKQYGYTFYHTRGGPMKSFSWGVTTQNASSVFLHVFASPTGNKVSVPAHIDSEKIKSLNGGKFKVISTNPDLIELEIQLSEGEPDTIFELPKKG